MIRVFTAFIFFQFMVSGLSAGIITLEGVYQGKNLYIQNPFTSSGVGFCTTEVMVNDVKSTDELQSSAFEIDFSNFKLKLGDNVTVKIRHRDDCAPKVLNPEVLKMGSTYVLVSSKTDENTIRFTTKNESSPLPFTIEQFRWDKWVKVAEVPGKGNPEENNYSIKINTHAGLNKFRIVQTDFKGPKYSNVIQYKSTRPEITFYPVKASTDLNFSDETMFEVWNQYGEVVMRGMDKKADVSKLVKGPYFLNYDNKKESFFKK